MVFSFRHTMKFVARNVAEVERDSTSANIVRNNFKGAWSHDAI